MHERDSTVVCIIEMEKKVKKKTINKTRRGAPRLRQGDRAPLFGIPPRLTLHFFKHAL